MKLGDLKYLFAFLLPLFGFYSVYASGWQSYSALIFGFGLLPLIETILPPNAQNLPQAAIDDREIQKYFDYLLFLNVPIVFALLYYYFTQLGSVASTSELIGKTCSVGMILSTSGINVAHELGHKPGAREQGLAKLLLLPSLYIHFIIEHNFGHHLNVSTPEDPATSRKGEWLYFFWFRSTLGGYMSAWKIENKRLNKAEQSIIGIKNQMILFSLIQLIYLGLIFLAWGPFALFCALTMAVFSFLLLETINYVEHYGLMRSKNAAGKYERVGKQHSWNSNHILGRIMLYELTRHSDHHYKAAKKYQVLHHHDESPQLPFGYPASMLISLVPPLWIGMMNRRMKT